MPFRSFTFPHTGLTVPDLDAAVAWYVANLGFELLLGPVEVLEENTPLGAAAVCIYGQGFGRFRFAHLSTPDDVGLELFQFEHTRPRAEADGFDFTNPGYHHIGLTAPDIAGALTALVAAGARARTGILTIDEQKGYLLAYLEDPWGSVIELCSHPYVEMWRQ